MRINLALDSLLRTNEAGKKLVIDLAREFGEEYDIDEHSARGRFFCNANPEVRRFVADYLGSQGWAIEPYDVPKVDDKIYSFGYVIDESCDRMVQWKLTNL